MNGKQLISYQEKEIEMEQKSIDLQQETLQTTYELNRLKKSYALDEEEFQYGEDQKQSTAGSGSGRIRL